jgi:hypothetical protein
MQRNANVRAYVHGELHDNPELLTLSRMFTSQPRDNIRTIEGVLFDALVRAGAVSRDNADDPTKVPQP